MFCFGFFYINCVLILFRSLFSFSGQNLVPEPPLQVQEVVEKWRNPTGAACGFERVASLHVSANDRLGLSTFHPEDEQCEPHVTSKQQPAAHRHRDVVLPGQLLLVLVHELCDASAAAGAAQLGHQRWNDILKHTNRRNSLGWGAGEKKNRTILVKTNIWKTKTKNMPIIFILETSCVWARVCAMRTLRIGEVNGARPVHGPWLFFNHFLLFVLFFSFYAGDW